MTTLHSQLATKIEEFDIKFDPDLVAQFIIDNYGISENQIESLEISEGTLYGQDTLDITGVEPFTIQILTFEDGEKIKTKFYAFKNILFYSFHN